jgi:hypothetical protein
MENFNSAPEVKVESEPKDFRLAHKSPTGILGYGEFVTKKLAIMWMKDQKESSENKGIEFWIEDKDGNKVEGI